MNLGNNLALAVHPLVFETGIPEAAHSIAGTGFLVGYGRRIFLVTARHALRPDAIYPLCILSPSGHVLPLKDVYFVPAAEVDEDFTDLAVVELDMQRVASKHRDTRVIPLESVTGDWQQAAQISGCFVLGFPNQHSCVDYDTGEVQMGFVELAGTYRGVAQARYLHEFKVENPPPLESFSGFSGGPVFCRRMAASGHEVLLLCGMAVQGSAESRMVRFIEASVIHDMLELKCARDPG